MKFKKYLNLAFISLLLILSVTSCLNNDDKTVDYADWIRQNETYLAEKEAETDGAGNKVYEKFSPSWAPDVYVLAKWHNDRNLTASNLSPMDNSTCDVIYEGYYVNGTLLDSSASQYADSIYTCRPCDNIAGFWAMLTKMHVGDSVTCVIPMAAAYGAESTSVVPYSTLIYNIKLKAIKAYEVSGK